MQRASEVHVVVSDLFSRLQVALLNWPPESAAELGELVEEVQQAADRLGKLNASKPRTARARRRWAAAETPPSVDPPTFPGPKKQRKKN